MTNAFSENWERVLGAILFIISGFFYAASGLLAPLWGIVVLWAVWIVLLVLMIRWWRRSPRRVLVLPFVAGLVWAIVMTVGDQVLDWKA